MGGMPLHIRACVFLSAQAVAKQCCGLRRSVCKRHFHIRLICRDRRGGWKWASLEVFMHAGLYGQCSVIAESLVL